MDCQPQNEKKFLNYKMNIIGVIPARSGSSEIKNKNIQKIKNQSLLQISIKKLNILK